MMQIDRIALDKRKLIRIKVGSSRISQEHLDQNEKLTEYDEGKRCGRCHMIMDVGEHTPCKYCTGDFINE